MPVLALAERCGLHRLVGETVTVSGPAAANPAVKVPALIAGMVADADSIDDMDVLRHGGMGRLFAGIRAPSTLGSFLRTFRFGHVRQLDKVAAGLLTNLAAHTPLLRDADRMSLVDIDDTVKATYGYAKQGAGYGYTKVKGLNALIGIMSTPVSAPVIAATRLRRGPTNSTRGAARLVADTLTVAQRCGATGLVVVRADSAFFNADVVAAIRRRGARFSITARHDAAVVAAIASIPERAWTPIRYPEAIWDEAEQRWVSDAEVAETGYTAFTSRRVDRHVTARLIVRRVRRLNTTPGQDELVPGYRYHAVFTEHTAADGPGRALPPRACHRRASHRRSETRSDRPFAVWVVHRERCLAGLRGDGVQPDPGRRLSRVDLPREGDHRHHPGPADHHPRTDRQLGPPDRPAPPRRLALGTSLAGTVHPGLRTTRHRDLTTRPRGPTGDQKWKSRTDRQPSHARPANPTDQDQLQDTITPIGGSRLRRP